MLAIWGSLGTVERIGWLATGSYFEGEGKRDGDIPAVRLFLDSPFVSVMCSMSDAFPAPSVPTTIMTGASFLDLYKAQQGLEFHNLLDLLRDGLQTSLCPLLHLLLDLLHRC